MGRKCSSPAQRFLFDTFCPPHFCQAGQRRTGRDFFFVRRLPCLSTADFTDPCKLMPSPVCLIVSSVFCLGGVRTYIVMVRNWWMSSLTCGNCTCTHRGLKVRGIVPNHRKSPVCPNCFLFVSRDHQRSFLEDLAKLRADLRFWSDWWYSASSSVKRRQHTTIQHIDGKLDFQLTASLALGRGPLANRQP